MAKIYSICVHPCILYLYSCIYWTVNSKAAAHGKHASAIIPHGQIFRTQNQKAQLLTLLKVEVCSTNFYLEGSKFCGIFQFAFVPQIAHGKI